MAAAGVAAGTLIAVGPTAARFHLTCPFLAVTGYYCPGCGSTRAMDALLRGELGEAFGRNPLAVLAVPVVAALWLAWARRRITGRPRHFVAPSWLLWTLAAVVVLFWLLRNLPIGAALAP